MSRLQTRGLALLAMIAVPGVAQAAESDGVFKDWVVVCDNLRNCEADGFAADEVEKPAFLQLQRGGAPGAPASVTIWLMSDDDLQAARGKPVVVAVDGRMVLTAKVADDGGVKLAHAQVGPLLGAARNGTLLSVRREDNEIGVVSLAGMVAALRRVDDAQKRVDTITAMVAKGPKPASAVPSQPLAPVVRRAQAVAQAGLPARPPPGVKALAAKAECDVYQDTAPGEPEVHRLSADQVLWQIPCGAGAYNFTSLFVITDSKGGAARLAPLDGAEDSTAVNAQYEPKTRILSAYGKGRGIGDCGESSEWAWTGQGFVLTTAASMPVCRGQSAWPVSYQAKVE